jgi:nitroreductase
VDIYEAIRLRKSVRDFTDREVPEAVIQRLIEAARIAPSASNRQEWRFVTVRKPGTRKAISEAAFGQSHVAQAPVVLVCCAETDLHVMACGQQCYPMNVSIAMTHIILCAAAEGLGTCWIGAFNENQVKKILGIPEAIRVVALLPLGYPIDPAPEEKNRLPLEHILKYERW